MTDISTTVEAVDVVDKLDLVSKVTNLSKNKWAQLSAVGVGVCVLGLGAGYFLGKRKVTYEWPGPAQIDFPEGMRIPGGSEPVVTPPPVIVDSIPDRILTPEEVSRRVTGVVTDESGDEAHILITEADPEFVRLLEEEEDIEAQNETVLLPESDEIIPEPDELINAENDDPVVDNVFASASSDGEWDWDAELEKRHADIPYVIHEDEFQSQETGFTQSTFTFYTGDETLVDESERPVYNYSSATGPLLFGHGTNDSNVVHIRNEKLKAEYQILRFDGHYAEEIQGLKQQDEAEAELKHSVSKFRLDD